jgi:hypothetical protein
VPADAVNELSAKLGGTANRFLAPWEICFFILTFKNEYKQAVMGNSRYDFYFKESRKMLKACK